jgi:iron(III) transport system permease protein
MARWRVAVGILLFLLLALPVALPFLDLLGQWRGWRAWAEGERLLHLAGNTLGLLAGTLSLSLPAGIAGAVLLYRTDLPLRGLLRFLTILTLFVPLPLFAAAWQAALGSSGWLPLRAWRTPEIGAPWAQGMTAAVWVHAVAALPWVILLVGQGLCWIERELEEDALTVLPPWRVLLQITLPRCRVVVGAAALWVALQTATEITITDLMKVRTFAEEVYTQFVGPETGVEAPLARAVAVSVPAFLLAWALAAWAVARWERGLPALETLSRPPWQFRLGQWRWPCLVLALAVGAALIGVPVASLVWKTGLSGEPPAWSWPVAQRSLGKAWRVRRGLIVESVLLAAGAGALTAGLGLLVCWLARGARWFQAGVLLLLTAAWALPGPVVGLGLKATIALFLDWVPSQALAQALYYGPSPLPVLWAYLLRFFPYAVALLWPVVRLVPRELHDMARVDGLPPGRELWHLVLPLTWPAAVRAGVAVAVLALGELSAGKLVETPGSQTFAHEVFMQMHNGLGNDLAALCLILLAAVLVGATLLGGVQRGLRLRHLLGDASSDPFR